MVAVLLRSDLRHRCRHPTVQGQDSQESNEDKEDDQIVTRRKIQFQFRVLLPFLRGDSFLYIVLFFVTTVSIPPQSFSSKNKLVRFGQGRYSLNDNEPERGVSWVTAS